MPMSFEKAIEEAPTLFLFDRRSQQQLHEMAMEAPPRSRDRYLILLTQAAFAYYNAAEIQNNTEMPAIIRQVREILQEVKQFREDRVFSTMALRLEVDVLLQQSLLHYQAGESPEENLFNEEDARALSICGTLLKNLPENFDPFPNSWFSSLVPLFPPYREEVLTFYKDRVKDNRVVPLQAILEKVQRELIVAAGIISAKKFAAEHHLKLSGRGLANRYLATHPQTLMHYVEKAMPPAVLLAADVTMPRGVSSGHLDLAVDNVQNQISRTREEKDLPGYTGQLLQLGILNFLRENPAATVGTLVKTLNASGKIPPDTKKLRQYRYEEFADIPFMMGTSYLRLLLPHQNLQEGQELIQRNGKCALMRSLVLQPQYHQAYVNLLVALHYGGEYEGVEELVRLYLENFGGEIARVNGLMFRNLAVLNYRKNKNRLTPDIVKWLLLEPFSTGGQPGKAGKMLLELKTLYILNAHDFSIPYLNAYQTGLRMRDEDFVRELENTEVHSAILFYLAHAHGSLTLIHPKNSREVVIDFANLEQSIELNGEALYFNPNNRSALRLVDTLGQVLVFGLQRSATRWESINNNLGQRFQFYEDYLRLEKGRDMLAEQLDPLGLVDKVPTFQLPSTIMQKMEEALTEEQRERMKTRVTTV